MQYHLEHLRKVLDRQLRNPQGPLTTQLLVVLRFLTQVGIEFYQERCFYMASTLAFSSAFALVPVSSFYFSIFAAFPSFKKLIDQARLFVVNQFTPQSEMQSEVTRYFSELTTNVTGLTSLSVLSLVVTAVMLYITLEDCLNKVFAVRMQPSLQRSLVTFTNLLFWGPLFMGLSAYLWFESMRFTALSTVAGTAWGQTLLTFLVSWLMFTVAYWLLPYGNTGMISALLGGLVGAELWELAKSAFSFYLQNSFMYSRVYGSIGFIPVTLLWIYTSCLIFLFGGKVSFCYQFRDMLDMLGTEAERDPILLTHATLASLLIIARRFRTGEPPISIHELSRMIKAPSHLIQVGLLALVDKRILHPVTRRGDMFLPARSLESITMREAFWATYPQTPQIQGNLPEIISVQTLVLKVRDAISGVLQDQTVGQAVDAPRAQQEFVGKV